MMLQNKTTHIVLAACAIVLIACDFSSPPVYGNETAVRIGVLTARGREQTAKRWTPTALYLSRRVPGHTFTIVPLNFHELGPVVGSGGVDFVVTSTSFYVELESRYGVSRIATLKNKRKKQTFTVYGGVIFCRNDRRDIRKLQDLKGKAFMAVEETSLGGWRAALREFKAEGIEPYRDFQKLVFGGTHDAVVHAVRDGVVDAGTVRTDTLEDMRDAGLIDLATFRVLNPRSEKGFPLALSTRLYPEWPFAKVRTTSDELARRVVIALLNMSSKAPAALASDSAGWTISLDYQPVHDLMKELRMGPYSDYGKITPADMIREYPYGAFLVLLTLVAALLTAGYFFGLNRKLYAARIKLQQAQESVEETVQERTAQLRAMNEELEQEIADRVRSEMEKVKLQKQLYHIQKMEAIGVLAGGIAHDFNNILTSIIGYGTLALKKLEGDPQVSKYLENILTASSRAVTLTRGLLTFSRKQVIAPKPDDLNSIVRSVESLLLSLIGETIEYKANLNEDEIIVLADSGQLGQVIMNLATNAKDAMPEGGEFTVTTSVVELGKEFFRTRPHGKPGNYAVLSVSDTGCGMDASVLEKSFEPFFTTKEVGKGTGLGLAIVFGIVEQHDGYLTVNSAPGKGTTFTFYLPIVQESVAAGKNA